jgi:hypothetical protein
MEEPGAGNRQRAPGSHQRTWAQKRWAKPQQLFAPDAQLFIGSKLAAYGKLRGE